MDQLNTQLTEAIFSLSRIWKDRMDCKSELVNLSVLQLQALIFIKKHPESTMNEIASYFSIELPSATSLVSKLVKLKLVKRVADKKDRRIVRIILTSYGEKLFEDAMKQRTEKIGQILSHLDKEDKEDFLKIITKLIATMKETDEK